MFSVFEDMPATRLSARQSYRLLGQRSGNFFSTEFGRSFDDTRIVTRPP
jgi:hypothetical protein